MKGVFCPLPFSFKKLEFFELDLEHGRRAVSLKMAKKLYYA